jgi:hypothetical protein
MSKSIKTAVFSLIVWATLSWATPGMRSYTTVDTDSITIGERIHFTVSLVVAPGVDISPPPVEEGIGECVVKGWERETYERETTDSISFSYVITTYSTGICTIPKLPYIVGDDDESDTLYSIDQTIHVLSVIDTDSATLRDIKPPQVAGTRSFLLLWICIGILGLLLIAIAVWQQVRSRGGIHAGPPPKPPFEEAMEALEKLKAQNYIKRGMIREYVFGLSNIAKRYTERRFGVTAAEFTTEEMLAWIPNSPLDTENRTRLHWFFTHTHLVKFARFSPDMATLERYFDEIETFICSTRPAPEKEQKNETTDGDNAAQES